MTNNEAVLESDRLRSEVEAYRKRGENAPMSLIGRMLKAACIASGRPVPQSIEDYLNPKS
jgi:hypothetical protein